MATDHLRFDPVGPVFEFLARPSTRGVAWAWARRDLDMAAAPAARRELTALVAPADGPDRVLVHLGVKCFVDLHGLRVLVDVGAQLRVRDGELVVVGRTSPLSPRQAEELAAVLTPAGPDHPWPDRIGTGRFGGGRLSVPLTRIEPELVVEVSADAALQAGVFRHPLRFVRVRPDLVPGDLPPLP